MVNVLGLTATHAAQLLDSGEITSVQLAEAYLKQIASHNKHGMCLNAIISVVPHETILDLARQLDEERRSGHKRGPLHGVPFVWKDVFPTTLGIPCTGGAPCLLTARPKRNAPLIQHLLDSGLLPLGSTNLTEFCGMKYETITPGWSPAGGQTQSPFVFGGLRSDDGFVGHSSIGGSSAGSAASVAAGFAPLAIGTQCVGSLILPASRGALYALNCGLGEVDAEGMFHFSDNTDFLGGMATDAKDLALFTATMMKRAEPFDLEGGLLGLRIGFLDSRAWQMSEGMLKATEEDREQMDQAYEEAKQKFSSAGALVSKVDLEHPSTKKAAFEWKGKSIFYEVTRYQMKHTAFPNFFNEFDGAEVRSVPDMIKWNVDHADQCLPPKHPYQTQFYDLLHSVPEDEYQEMRAAFPREGDDLVNLFDTVDVVVTHGESSLVMYTSAAGCPIAAAPLGTVKYSEENERPFGLAFAAKKGSEGLLLRVLSAFQEFYPDRALPRPLMVEEKA